MRLKLIHCQVFSREMGHVVSRPPHSEDVGTLTMGCMVWVRQCARVCWNGSTLQMRPDMIIA